MYHWIKYKKKSMTEEIEYLMKMDILLGIKIELSVSSPWIWKDQAEYIDDTETSFDEP